MLNAFVSKIFLWQFVIAWSNTKEHDKDFIMSQCQAMERYISKFGLATTCRSPSARPSIVLDQVKVRKRILHVRVQ